ncbi:MAG: hypothetical protein P1U54_03330 [Immundisolibacteraceae bacterium]|nr:hypothetical protein [Immundisolibacteraceae bacterium]
MTALVAVTLFVAEEVFGTGAAFQVLNSSSVTMDAVSSSPIRVSLLFNLYS